MSIYVGALEYWSVGVMAKGLMLFFNTPILHHSSTPGPRLSRTFGTLKITFLGVIFLKKHYITAFSYHSVLAKISNPTDS